MVAAKWEDPSSSLELWAALAELAWKGKDKQNVRLHTYKRTACVCDGVQCAHHTSCVYMLQAERCASEALKVGQLAVEHLQRAQGRGAGQSGDKLSLCHCHQLLSLAYNIKGGCLESKAASDTAILKEAQQAFLAAARWVGWGWGHRQQPHTYVRTYIAGIRVLHT